jgi:hypothetical protein
MKKRSDMRLQLANQDGMPDELFKDFQTIQTERFKEIRNFLVTEYFVRFHNEIHFDSANTLAVIETQISCRFDEARRIENLTRFGEEFFAEEMPLVSITHCIISIRLSIIKFKPCCVLCISITNNINSIISTCINII